MALKSKVIFRERGKGEQQGAFIHVSSATQEKTKNFLENLTVSLHSAGCCFLTCVACDGWMVGPVWVHLW